MGESESTPGRQAEEFAVFSLIIVKLAPYDQETRARILKASAIFLECEG